jgi:2-polyprenyl-6-methoxyphenol hydroxylase-like FAD-dependent oxidoreductase
MPTDPQVLVVGAGPTGLALALWLTRQGVRVRIIDKTPEPGTTSRALGVHARTLELYRQIDLANATVAGGVRTAALNFWVQGRRVARAPIGDMGQGLSPFPFVLIYPQDQHERLLAQRLSGEGVTVDRQTELVGFDQDADGVRATLRRADGSEERCTTSYIAGCDGARSTVRETLGIGFPGGTYSGMFYVADVQAVGVPPGHELHIDLDESDLLAVFPLQGEGRVRLVGTVRDETAAERGQLTFRDVEDRALRQLHVSVTTVNWFSTYRVHHRVAYRFRDRRAFLLGDAAHIHSPVGAQGMNTGIGDAINLAWKLSAVLRGRALAGLLDSYEPERIAFARRLVATTDRVFTLAASRRLSAQRMRTTIFPAVVGALFRARAARRYLFRTVSQIGIRYRESALSEGRAGRVHGGDRLPWVPNGASGGSAEDNFSPLTSLAWQVHVYGDPKPALRDICARLRVPLHAFTWTPSAKRAGLARDAFYLVRPDGYVGVAGDDDPHVLESYVARQGLTFG